MLSLTDVKCLLLTMLSIYNNSVCNASSCNNRSLTTAFKHLLVIFTRASIVPPIYGLFGGSSIYCVQFSFNSFIIFFRSSLDRVSLSSLSAQIKLLPLSLRILLGCPLLAFKRPKVKIKLIVDISPASSRWTAGVVIHVKSARYRFAVPDVLLVLLFNFMVNDPNWVRTGVRSGLLMSMLGKRSWFRLIALITVVLL